MRITLFFFINCIVIYQNNWPMAAIGSCDQYGNFIPLATMICSGSGQENFEMFLTHFKGSLGDRIPAEVTVITDKCDPARLAIKAVLPQARVRLCYWHFTEAVRRWLVKATNGVQEKADQQIVKEAPPPPPPESIQ